MQCRIYLNDGIGRGLISLRGQNCLPFCFDNPRGYCCRQVGLIRFVANAVIMSGGLAFVANGSSTHEVRACLSNALPPYDFRVRCCLVSLRR